MRKMPGMTKEHADLAFLQHRRGQLRDWAALSFDKKMEMLAEMSEMPDAMGKSHAQSKPSERVAEDPPA